ncbi:hypothetical protein EYC84_005509 [Monilinia fructicola]|uniref:Uncharacterized protein n=1 Tax=Monilinia fructicola TaxID=38448 RepID=A0A5M9JZ79_MONFR|nr:hypothetical protein EYC84_005509 [Monilinia fructicola]
MMQLSKKATNGKSKTNTPSFMGKFLQIPTFDPSSLILPLPHNLNNLFTTSINFNHNLINNLFSIYRIIFLNIIDLVAAAQIALTDVRTIPLHISNKPSSSNAKMPASWKTYDATVRLLAAIVAAHPGFKFDYAAISVRFGGDCTVSALENRFKRLKSDAKLINAAVANGEDPININVADTNGQNVCKSKGAMSELMGSETPVGHISSQHRETWKPLGERLIAMRNAGEDCKDVDLTGLGSRRYKAEIAVKMGSDTTAGGIKKQFTRSYRVLAARQDALCADGKDPKDASLEHLGAHKRSGDISAEVAKYMGSAVTIAGVKMQYSRHIRPLYVKISLVPSAIDPKAVLDSPESVYGKVLFCPNYTDSPKPPETARIMGSDTTPSSLINHFRRTVKILADRQVSMLAAGEDSKDVSLEMLGLGQSKGGQKFCLLKIVAIMGSDVTIEAIKQQISKRIKALGSRQIQMREAGQDPKDVDLEDLMPSKKGKEMDKFMGDSTAGGIRFQFDTRYKVIAQRQKSMLAVGKNPSTVDIETSGKGKSEIQKCFGSDATIGGLKFQFATSIKKNVEQILSARAAGKDCKDIIFSSNATAEKYGEGVTGSAKKPRAPRTPSKKGKKAAASSEEGNMDDDSDMEMITPSKKSSPVKKETMNKVKGGRVEKKIVTPGRKAKTGVKNYVDSDDEGEDGDGILIKDEDLDSMDFGRAVDGDDDMLGGGFGARGNGNGHRNGGTVVGEAHDEDEDRFYDDES